VSRLWSLSQHDEHMSLRGEASGKALAEQNRATPYEILALAQLFRDRADAANNFNELKNQWGVGGFMTQDLARCRLMVQERAA
jgi:hypothetical protein